MLVEYNIAIELLTSTLLIIQPLIIRHVSIKDQYDYLLSSISYHFGPTCLIHDVEIVRCNLSSSWALASASCLQRVGNIIDCAECRSLHLPSGFCELHTNFLSISVPNNHYKKLILRSTIPAAMKRMVAEGSRPQPPLTWENNENFGIVHTTGCSVCSPYISHLVGAAFANDPSFQRARESGRSETATSHHAELEQARATIARLRAELAGSQEECRSLKLRLKSYTARRDFASPDTLESSRSSSPVDSLSSDESCFATPEAGTDDLPPTDTILDPGTSRVSESPLNDPMPSAPFTVPSDERLPEIQPQQHIVATERRYSDVRSNSYAESVAASSTGPASSSWHTSGRVIKTPKTIKQVDTLLKDANKPGNIDHYKKVKELCAEAHAAADMRTNLQKYLLVKWRTPEWVKGTQGYNSGTLPVTPPLNPLRDDPPEKWVEYYAIFPASIPSGVRMNADGKPRLSDMRASRTMARLRPEMMVDGPTTAQARLQFKETAIHLFSDAQRYRQLTRNGSDIAQQVVYEPFVGSLESITTENVAQHFAACGISVKAAYDEMEPWARECLRAWDAKKAAA